MFRKHLVTKYTVDDAHDMFRQIFPDEKLYEEDGGSLKSCFSEAAKTFNDPNVLWNYYIYTDSSPEHPLGFSVGMSGIYLEDADPDSAWLGWLGVLPEYRREHYGTRIMNEFLNECRERGFKFARLYTNENNIVARAFYEANGFIGEKYNGEVPECVKTGGDVWIYSKSLCPAVPCIPWGDRHLDF